LGGTPCYSHHCCDKISAHGFKSDTDLGSIPGETVEQNGFPKIGIPKKKGVKNYAEKSMCRLRQRKGCIWRENVRKWAFYMQRLLLEDSGVFEWSK
jgi:hypothetical protein